MPGVRSRNGTVLNAPFTIGVPERYIAMMLVLALIAATAAADTPASSSGEAVEQARASVRVISGVRVSAEQPPQEALVRDTETANADGSWTRSRLIEFP